MNLKKLLALALVLTMVPGLCACVRKKPKVDRDPVVIGELTGKYWIDSMIDDGEVMTKDILKMVGWDDSFLQFNADGTALFSLTGEKTAELRYDEKECVLFNDAGKTMSFSVSGDKVTLDYDGSQMVFVREAGQEPVKPTEPKPTQTQPTEPRPTETEPTEPQPTEPQPTEPQPTEPQPTEPQPTEPKPTEPRPTEPQPTEPQPTEPEPTQPQDGRLAGKYLLFSMILDGELIDKELMDMAGEMAGSMTKSYIAFREDGTAEFSLSEKGPRQVTCDYDTMHLVYSDGSYLCFSVEGDVVHVWEQGSEDILIFAPEGSDYLK